MYFGQAQHAVDFFDRLGAPLPPRVNAADFLLDLASGEEGGLHGGEEGRARLMRCAAAFLAGREQEGFDLGKDSGDQEAAVAAARAVGEPPPQAGSEVMVEAVDRAVSNGTHEVGNTNGDTSPVWKKQRLPHTYSLQEVTVHGSSMLDDSRWGAPYLKQIAILFSRSLRTRRFSVSLQLFGSWFPLWLLCRLAPLSFYRPTFPTSNCFSTSCRA
jgi:hypothetical protein